MKPFYLYNTLTRRVEPLHPLHPPIVTYYSCGPTVYLPQHLGNLRAYLFVDTLKRALEFNGYQVRHVMNVTDVGHMTSQEDDGEDKIEKTARAEGRTPREVADFYLAQFKRDCAALNIRLPEPPLLCRATDHVPEMQALIERILDRGCAYVTPSGVYFDVQKWRGADRVGRLSRQSLDEQHAGQRLEHSPDKKSPHDFALWVLNQPAHLMQWPSPWGPGYPGWHIECSAMSMKYLGETIDIHSGGMDHIPIHHENEIAQSEAATGKPFVRCFVHNAFLVEKEGVKISKSAGKFPLLSDLAAAGIDPLAFRLFCFGAKYRSELVLGEDGLKSAQSNLEYFREFARNLGDQADADTDSPWAEPYAERFGEALNNPEQLDDELDTPQAPAPAVTPFSVRWQEALNNDLNTPQALAVALELVAEAYRRNDRRVWNTLRKFDSVIGLGLEDTLARARGAAIPAEVSALIEQRTRARASRDFTRSDELRRKIEALGYEVKDSRDGSSYVARK